MTIRTIDISTTANEELQTAILSGLPKNQLERVIASELKGASMRLQADYDVETLWTAAWRPGRRQVWSFFDAPAGQRQNIYTFYLDRDGRLLYRRSAGLRRRLPLRPMDLRRLPNDSLLMLYRLVGRLGPVDL